MRQKHAMRSSTATSTSCTAPRYGLLPHVRGRHKHVELAAHGLLQELDRAAGIV